MTTEFVVPQWAKDAADAVFGELGDRSGFDHWWGNIGKATRRPQFCNSLHSLNYAQMASGKEIKP